MQSNDGASFTSPFGKVGNLQVCDVYEVLFKGELQRRTEAKVKVLMDAQIGQTCGDRANCGNDIPRIKSTLLISGPRPRLKTSVHFILISQVK